MERIPSRFAVNNDWEEAQLSFSQAISAYYNNYAEFNGRTTRSGFWYVILYQIGIYIALGILASISTTFGLTLYAIFAFAHIIPSIAITVRRLHDSGLSGWHILWGFIPFFIGFVIMVILLVRPTKEIANSNRNEWDDLERLAELRDKGVITEEEFETKKAEFLQPSG